MIDVGGDYDELEPRDELAELGGDYDELEPRDELAELGFVVTPDEIKDRIAALDAAVQALDGDIHRSTSTAVNAPWRAQWSAFVRRWQVERDSYASWGSRLFATRVIPRIEQYQSSYNLWAGDFQRRTGVAPTVPAAAEPEGLAAGIVPTQVWWIAAGCAALYVVINARR